MASRDSDSNRDGSDHKRAPGADVGSGRRKFIKATGAAGVAGLTGLSGCLGGIGGGGSTTITMLAWDDFDIFSDGVEEKLDITLDVTKSNDSSKMFSKWNAGGDEDFDITVPNNNYVQRFADADLIEPVNTDIVTNYADLFPKFKEFADEQFTRNGEIHGVPIRFGWYGYSYDNRVLPDDHEKSYEALFSEGYAGADLEGKIIMYDNHFKSMAATALYLGYQDAFEGQKVTLSEGQVDEVKELMLEQKPLLQGYIGPDSTYIKSFRQGNHAIGLSGRNEIMDMNREGDDWAKMAKPEEGELAWFEGMVVSKQSENKETAWEVVNQYIDPDFGPEFAKAASTPSCNPEANAQLEGNNKALFGFGPERLDGMIPFKAVENEEYWLEAWEEIKAA